MLRGLLTRREPAAAAASRGVPSQARRVVVLEEGRTPSGDYLLHPWLARSAVPVLRIDSRIAPGASALEAGDFVVILRYLGSGWRSAIARQRAALSGLAYFMDDDLLDPAVLAELAPAYAGKIKKMALGLRPWLEKAGCQWWVSTAALAQKYAALSPTQLPLAPPPEMMETRASVKVAYHGTASHAAELDWLRGVIEEVQTRCEHTHFEVFGDMSVNRQYRDLPRVAVMHPMRWESYLAYTASHAADIGLAPLLPGRMNAGRGAIKFFDYARMGAAGVYTDAPPYAGFIRDGVDGRLLSNDPTQWVAAIMLLVEDATLRAQWALSARQRARVLASSGP